MGKSSKELRMGIHNRFDIEVVDVETGEVKQRARAFNVVCNGYYSAVLQDYPTLASVIQFGSGSGTPASTDTALFNYVGYASSDNVYSPYDRIDASQEHLGIWSRQLKRTIPNTQYVGTTITEVGLSTSNSGGTLITHAMLQDMNGNPISIVHTSTDVINVYCTLFLHYDGQDSDVHLYYATGGTKGNASRSYAGILAHILLSKDGENYSYWGSDTVRARIGDEEIGGVGGIYNTSSDKYPLSLNTTWTINSASRSRTIKAPQLAVTQGNIGGIGSIGFKTINGDYQVSNNTYIDTNILIEVGRTAVPPTRISGETVGVGDGSTTRFTTKNKKPYNASVYVNGVIQTTGVQVKKYPNEAITGYGKNNSDYRFTSKYFLRKHRNKATLLYPLAGYLSGATTNFTGATEQYGFTLAAGDVIEVATPEIGIYGISAINGNIKASDDGNTWVDVTTISGGDYATPSNVQIADADAHYKYYKNIGTGDQRAHLFSNNYDGYNIIFDNPPAQGDVITIDYTTDYIPKDSDHVLDVSITFTFGEWTGE